MDTSIFAQRSFGDNPLISLFYVAIVGYLILRVIFSINRTTGRNPAEPPRPPREGLDEADPLEGVEPLDGGVPPAEEARLRTEIRRFQQSRNSSQAVPPPLETAPPRQSAPTVSAAESVFDDPAPQDSGEPAGGWNAAALAASLQNPSEFKRALLLSEILRRRDWE